jgi:predicted protein tyrosine phosphatase
VSIDYNRRSVIENPYQGSHKRVLCICSGGVLRSPTAAYVLSQPPFDCNTRSAGTETYALVPVDEALLLWAQEIVCMTSEHFSKVKVLLERFQLEKPVIALGVPDNFAYRDPELVKIIKERYSASPPDVKDKTT